MKKIKQIFSLFLAVVLLLCAPQVPLTAVAATPTSGTCGDNLTWTLDEEGTLTISGTGAMYDYLYGGVDSPWCRDYSDSIKKIVIEDGVTTIGEYAFSGFENLTQIQVGKDLASIGKKAIGLCYSMAVVTVDPGNTQFSSDENGVLFNKDKSTLIYYPIGKVGAYAIPNTVKTISEDAFDHCAGLTAITIPDSVTKIEGSPFYCCTGLTEVVVPDSVVSMGNAFQNCENLTKVTIGDSVTVLASGLFFGCNALKKVELGNSITTIHEEVFFAAYDLENVILPETVTTIGARSFGSCRSMTKITIPAAVTSIGAVAFGNCAKVTEIYFDGSAPAIGINAFGNITATAYYYPDSTWTDEVMQNYGGNITWVPLEVPGDLDGDGKVTDADVIYLLWHTVFPKDYPIDSWADFTNNGLVTDEDVIYLLWHTVFPEDYPLEIDPADRVFKVGYGKENITPEESVPMGGYGRSDQRMAAGILSYLWATCVAITDADGNTILLMSVDLCNSLEASRVAPSISEATGVPVENIVISATHTHSAPDFSYTHMPAVSRALDKVHNGLMKAALTAMEDRKPAQMYGASVETANMNFVRHYLMNDGTYCGDNFGSTASGYKAHASEADPTMQLIKFTREGDNDIILTNFQTHPHRTGGSTKYDISADIVGEYRAAMEQDLGVEVIYFSGAGGNLNPTSRISRENVTSDFKKHGKALANYAKSAVYAPLNTGKVQASKMSFEAEINHADDAYAAVCADLRARWDRGEITTAQVISLGAAAGIKLNSPYHAGAIRNRANMGKSNSFPIWTYSFGDVGFVAAPYEMFDTNGMFIKENSPFEYTFISTIANKTNGYFPSDYGFSYGCYEVDTTSYVRGSAERLANEYVRMLTEQFNNQ